MRTPAVPAIRAFPPLGSPLLATLIALLVALPAGGCTFRGASGDLRTVAVDGSASLVPRGRVVVYSAQDESTADVYLTDLRADQLESTEPIWASTGSLVHIHLFIRPRAGRTPVEPTASTASVRHVVLTGGPVGVYGGGGFLMPSDMPGDARFSGAITAGTVRLIHASPGFSDRLGAADISGSFRAVQDDAMAALVAARLAEAIDAAR